MSGIRRGRKGLGGDRVISPEDGGQARSPGEGKSQGAGEGKETDSPLELTP